MHAKTPDGAELCVDTFGDPADPAVLLIMGSGGSMDHWEPAFCERLAAAGRHVIRYDHRDTGDSTTYPPGEPGYTGAQLAEDPIAVLDGLGVERAHVVGISMGGGIAQWLAAHEPGRVLGLALIATSPALDDELDLPGSSAALSASYADPPPEPDWTDRASAVRFLVEAERLYAGARGIDEPELRARYERAYDRSRNMASAANHWRMEDGPRANARLADLRAPALVIHGTHDPAFPPAHGEALARGIPGARLVLVEGLGHELPRWAWHTIVPELIELTQPRPATARSASSS